jgi:hypothetical protein
MCDVDPALRHVRHSTGNMTAMPTKIRSPMIVQSNHVCIKLSFALRYPAPSRVVLTWVSMSTSRTTSLPVVP